MNLGPVEIVVLVLGVALVITVFFVFKLRTAGEVGLDRWATNHGITTTWETREFIRRYLIGGIRWRTVGASIGFFLPLGTKTPGLEAMLGYLLAAILYELRARPLIAVDGHSAGLVPRTVADYLPSRALLHFRLACAAAVVTGLAFQVLPMRERVSGSLGNAPWLVVAAVLALWPVVETTLWMIARRRQTAGPAELVAADDALRSASMHAVLGAGIGMGMLLFGAAMLTLGMGTDVQVVRWIGPWLGLVSMALGLVSWLRFGHDTPWTVRRSAAIHARA